MGKNVLGIFVWSLAGWAAPDTALGHRATETVSVSREEATLVGRLGSAATGSGSRSLFGTHPRVQVTTSHAAPYRMTGQISLGCTGTLVGPRHVLTAGHCVYDIEKEKWYANLEFAPARNGASLPHGWLAWEKAYAVAGWTVDHDTNHDYALVILKTPLPATVGWMAYGHADSLAPDTIVSVAGYPGDMPEGTLWRATCPLLAVVPGLAYDCDTYNGQSGSAVIYYNPVTGARVIYGVHTNGGDSFNRGTRITATVFNNLKAWKTANP